VWKKGVDCSMSELITVKKTEKGVEVEVKGMWRTTDLQRAFRAIERANRITLDGLKVLKKESFKEGEDLFDDIKTII